MPIAHKTGDFPPVLANDVGIAYARSGPIVISFFANAIEGPYSEAEDRMGRIAQQIIEHFDKSAAAAERPLWRDLAVARTPVVASEGGVK